MVKGAHQCMNNPSTSCGHGRLFSHHCRCYNVLSRIIFVLFVFSLLCDKESCIFASSREPESQDPLIRLLCLESWVSKDSIGRGGGNGRRIRRRPEPQCDLERVGRRDVVQLSSTPLVSYDGAATDIMKIYFREVAPVSDFYIQGWRWHTLSLIRESDRLAAAARVMKHRHRRSSISTNKKDIIECRDCFWNAADYVVNFNMKGLHRIEKELFLPWILQRESINNQRKEVTQALQQVVEHLEIYRENVRKRGIRLMDALERSEGKAAISNAKGKEKDWLDVVARESKAISLESQHILRTSDALLVPLVRRHVSESEQKAFNNRVIRLLGLWDSRLHLVGMHQATLSIPEERALFQQIIPKLPQSMIPRWKRLLYDPRVEALKGFR